MKPARTLKLRLAGGGREYQVEICSHGRDGTLTARIDGREVLTEMQSLADGSVMLTCGGRRSRVYAARRGHSILVAIGPNQFELQPAEGRSTRTARGLVASEVTAPMPGKILRVLVNEGDQVEAAQPLLVMEAMKMESTLRAEGPAVINRVRVGAGAMVDHGDVLIELSPLADPSPP
jgi:acetyl/propionyl-CoA carboxylase alpha subunit